MPGRRTFLIVSLPSSRVATYVCAIEAEAIGFLSAANSRSQSLPQAIQSPVQSYRTAAVPPGRGECRTRKSSCVNRSLLVARSWPSFIPTGPTSRNSATTDAGRSPRYLSFSKTGIMPSKLRDFSDRAGRKSDRVLLAASVHRHCFPDHPSSACFASVSLLLILRNFSKHRTQEVDLRRRHSLPENFVESISRFAQFRPDGSYLVGGGGLHSSIMRRPFSLDQTFFNQNCDSLSYRRRFKLEQARISVCVSVGSRNKDAMIRHCV